MAEQFMFICDSCYNDLKDIIHIEQKKTYQKEKCAFCEQKKDCKYSRVVYGKNAV